MLQRGREGTEPRCLFSAHSIPAGLPHQQTHIHEDDAIVPGL